MTLDSITQAQLAELMENFDANYELLASWFRQVTGLSLGRCGGCRKEAAMILSNYITKRDAEKETTDDDAKPKRGRPRKAEE